MASKSFFGSSFVFTSRGSSGLGDSTEIRAGINEDLFIDQLKNNKVFSCTTTDVLGFNELQNKKDYQHTDVLEAENQGTAVRMIDVGADSYLAVGAPFNSDPTLGGVCVFKSTSGGDFLEDPTILAITTDSNPGAYGKFADMNETADRIVFTDFTNNAGTAGNIIVYDRSGSTWSSPEHIIQGGDVPLIKGDYLLTSTRNEHIKVYFDSSGYSLQQTILPLTSGGLLLIGMADSKTISYYKGNSIFIYNRVGTLWSFVQELNTSLIPNIISYKMVGNFIVACSTSKVRIYERQALAGTYSFVQEFSKTNITDVDKNDTRIFISTSTDIHIINLVNGIWTESVNSTIDSGSFKISCSNKFLSIGKPTNRSNVGEVTVYDIVDYTNAVLDTNDIDMSGTDINITSNFGNINLNGNVAIAQSSFPDGTAATPSIAFASDTDTGIYRSATNKLSITANATQIVEVGSADVKMFKTLKIPNGSEGAPSLTFLGEPGNNTGMYFKAADNIGFSANGTERLAISPAGIEVSGTTKIGNGSESSPSLAFSTNTDTGIFKHFTSAVSISLEGVESVRIGGEPNNTFRTASKGNTGVQNYNIFVYGDIASGTVTGSISSLGTTTNYNTTSDERLKYDITDLIGGCDFISEIKPRSYKWKADDSQAVGFIAQELELIMPELVSQGNDLNPTNPNFIPKMVDYTKLIPHLVCAVKELTLRVQQLEN